MEPKLEKKLQAVSIGSMFIRLTDNDGNPLNTKDLLEEFLTEAYDAADHMDRDKLKIIAMLHGFNHLASEWQERDSSDLQEELFQQREREANHTGFNLKETIGNAIKEANGNLFHELKPLRS